MWQDFLATITSKEILFYAFLSTIIPFGVNFIQHKLHQIADPPWKKKQNKKSNIE
ncbi:hypothetical protein [Aquibacillus albus]|uniref:YvrJ family protein n=1 Tax=Aquibacillus albus TaxID=1168171 RepID=A0ABS2N366_9BACI|nr:hypothetical protein [Aquibacillus albus]MBM7572562.1 hypothetical protein [Aquibacillus albus]